MLLGEAGAGAATCSFEPSDTDVSYKSKTVGYGKVRELQGYMLSPLPRGSPLASANKGCWRGTGRQDAGEGFYVLFQPWLKSPSFWTSQTSFRVLVPAGGALPQRSEPSSFPRLIACPDSVYLSEIQNKMASITHIFRVRAAWE